VIFPEQQNEKKVTMAAAHSITESKEGISDIQNGLILLRIMGVMGNRGL